MGLIDGVNDYLPIIPSDRRIGDSNYLLSEIKRLLIWDNHVNLRTREESAYVAFHKADVAANGGTINLHIKNPSDSGVSLDISEFNISSQFQASWNVFDSFSSAPSGGSGNGVDNLLMDSSGEKDTGVATVNSGVTFTSDGTHFAGVIGSGGAAGATTGGQGHGSEPVIEPGREIVIELQNDSSSERAGAIGVVYTEDPYIYSE